MSANTKIEWADHTFNPWIGCTKVSPGCDICYAEADFDKRRHVVRWGAGQPRHRTAPSTWAMPKRWDAQAAAEGRRFRVFCASLADVFDNEVPSEWRRDLFELIGRTPNLDWLLLTKRIGNAQAMLNEAVGALSHGLNTWDERPWPGVWIGATVVNQAEADRDIQKLLTVPAHVRFLSIEPMLGPVDIESACDIAERSVCAGSWADMAEPQRCFLALRHGSVRLLDWVICGGESGPQARPMHPEWARSLRDQCQAAGVPFLFKQWGEWTAHDVDPESYAAHLCCIDRHGGECALSRGDQAKANGEGWWFLPADPGRGTWAPDGIPDGVVEIRRIGKKAAGRLLDGIEHNGFPEGGAP